MCREQDNSCLDGLTIQAVSDLTVNSVNSQSWNIHVRYVHETKTTEKRNCKFGLLYCLKEKTIKLELLLHYLINSVVNRRVQFHLWNILIVKKILINEHQMQKHKYFIWTRFVQVWYFRGLQCILEVHHFSIISEITELQITSSLFPWNKEWFLASDYGWPGFEFWSLL